MDLAELIESIEWIGYLIIPFYGIINALRGSGNPYTPKWSLAFALTIFSFILFGDYKVATVLGLGFLMGFFKAMSMKALHGWNDAKTKFKYVTNLVNKYYMPQITGDKTWGVWYFTIYAALMQYPQFIILAIVGDNFSPVIIGLGVLLKGLILRLIGILFWEKLGSKSWRIFEFVYGSYLGFLIYMAVRSII